MTVTSPAHRMPGLLIHMKSVVTSLPVPLWHTKYLDVSLHTTRSDSSAARHMASVMLVIVFRVFYLTW